MLKTITNSFKRINLFINKNKKGLFLLNIGLLLLFIPTRTVHADIFSNIWNTITSIQAYIFDLPLNICILVSAALLLYSSITSCILGGLAYVLMVMFADFIIHASLTIPISPANIYTPEIIKTGWFFTIGFVNMFFALALTFIGLATILGIKDYEAKKLLPKLLFIAILVNFTPVIIGFIVDMGNLVTNVFVEATTFNISTLIAQVGDLFLIDKLVIFFRDSISNITGDFEVTLFSAINLEIQLFISFIYLWGAAFVWSCIAGMFVLRIVMLWILTILSPIAFFSFIVPDGSPFQMLFPDVLSWKKWWEEFLKWVIVGIPFGLFLYISQGMIAGGLSFTENVALEAGSLEGIDFKELVGNLIENSLVNITALILLYQGYQISLKAAPQAAQAMIKGTQKLVKTAAMAAVTGGVSLTASGLGGMASVGEKATAGLAKAKHFPGRKILKGSIGKASQGLRKRQVGMNKIKDKYGSQHSRLPEGFDKMSTDQQADTIKSLGRRGRTEAYGKIDKSKFSKSQQQEMSLDAENITKKHKNLGEKDKMVLKKTLEGELGSEASRTALAKDPQEAKEKISEKTEELKKRIEGDSNLKTKIDAEIVVKYGNKASDENKEEYLRDLSAQVLNVIDGGPKGLKKLGKKNIKSTAVKLASHEFGGTELEAIRSEYGTNVSKEVFNGPGSIGETSFEDLRQENPKLTGHLLNTQNGRAWNWKAGANLDEKYINSKTGHADARKINAQMTTEPPKAPTGVFLEEAEITARAGEIRQDRIDKADDPTYKFNGKFVNNLLKKAEIKPKTKQSDDFMNKWDKAEAGRQIIKEQQDLQKPITDADQSNLEKIKIPQRKIKRVEKLRASKRKLTDLGGGGGKKEESLDRKIKALQEKMKNKRFDKEEVGLASEVMQAYGDMNEAIKSISKSRKAKVAELKNSIQKQTNKIKTLNPAIPADNAKIADITNSITEETTDLIKKEKFLIGQKGIIDDKILEIKINLKRIDDISNP